MRSPEKYGSITRPAAPGDTVRASAVSRSKPVAPTRSRTQAASAPAVATVGSALLAAAAGGHADLSADWSGPAETVVPDPEATAAYEAPYRVYRELYPATRAQQHELADLAERSGSPREPRAS